MSDFPDDFGVQIFPGLGVPSAETFSVEIAGGFDATLFTVTAKAQVLGGYLRTVNDTLSKSDTITITIDSTVLCVYAFDALRRDGMFAPGILPVFLNTYDIIVPIYLVGFTPGTTFITSYKVDYHNGTVGPIIVDGKFLYFKIV